jgi:hypothetical protein
MSFGPHETPHLHTGCDHAADEPPDTACSFGRIVTEVDIEADLGLVIHHVHIRHHARDGGRSDLSTAIITWVPQESRAFEEGGVNFSSVDAAIRAHVRDTLTHLMPPADGEGDAP